MARQRILILGAGREALPGIRRALALGYDVVATDGNPQALGFAEATEAVHVSTYDIPTTVQAAQDSAERHGPYAGVLSVAADVPCTVAAVAETLGLPGLTPDAARGFSDKLVMKERLRDADIPIPWFMPIKHPAEIENMLEGYPGALVIKPVDSRGARGVLVLDSTSDADWAFTYSQGFSPTGRVMLEEYLPGPQISTEAVIHDGWAIVPGVIDRNYSRMADSFPHMIEDGGEQPSALALEDVLAVKRLTSQAGIALGMTSGTVKGDIVVTPDGPKVIEIAGRLSGGWMSSLQIPLSTGVDLLGIAIRLACNQPVSWRDAVPRQAQGVAIRYLWPAPGLVTRIDTTQLTAIPGVHAYHIDISPGERICAPTNHTQRAGWVMTTGATRAEAVARAEQATQAITIHTEEAPA